MTFAPLVEIDYARLSSRIPERYRAAARQEIIEQCLIGKIVVLKGVDLDVDLKAFEMAEEFPSALCKIGAHADDTPVDFDFHQQLPFRMVYPGSDPLNNPYVNQQDLTLICDRSFGGDWAHFNEFLQNCHTAEAKLRSVATEVLGDHSYYADCPVLRFSNPNQKMHFDDNPPIEGKEALRFFMNVDRKPRYWESSTTLFDFIEREYEALNLEPYFDRSAPDRMARLIKYVRGTSTFQKIPRVTLKFEPRDVWVFDGRVISHKVIKGRRALSLTAKMKLDSLPDYHVALKDRLFDIHAIQLAERSERLRMSSVARRVERERELIAC